MSSGSEIVCQVPNCSTTREEIESALKTFLSSFCNVCKQDRDGNLCGCPFPCSLTFRGRMLVAILDRLKMKKSSARKTIQVCFKHSELLDDARHSCVTQMRDQSSTARAREFTRLSGSKPSIPETDLSKAVPVEVEPSMADFLRDRPTNPNRPSVESRDVPISSPPITCGSFLNSGQSDTDGENDSEHYEIAHNNDVSPSTADESDTENESIPETSYLNSTLSQTSSRPRKVFKIKYQSYFNSILMHELHPLIHKSFLQDIQFACKDGQVTFNSLLLGSMSTFLCEILADVPIVDKMKVVILPDVQTADLEAFFRLLFAKETVLNQVSEKELKRIQSLANLFRIKGNFIVIRKPGRPKGSLNRPRSVINENETNPPSDSARTRAIQHRKTVSSNVINISSLPSVDTYEANSFRDFDDDSGSSLSDSFSNLSNQPIGTKTFRQMCEGGTKRPGPDPPESLSMKLSRFDNSVGRARRPDARIFGNDLSS